MVLLQHNIYKDFISISDYTRQKEHKGSCFAFFVLRLFGDFKGGGGMLEEGVAIKTFP